MRLHAKNSAPSKDRLDKLARAIVNVTAKPTSGKHAAFSAFLYPRIRVRIDTERRRRLQYPERPTTFIGTVWRFAPSMVLITTITLLLFWIVSLGASPPVVPNGETFLETSDNEIERVVFTTPQALSNDEVLSIILTEDEGENQQ